MILVRLWILGVSLLGALGLGVAGCWLVFRYAVIPKKVARAAGTEQAAATYGIERPDGGFDIIPATSYRVDGAGRLWLYLHSTPVATFGQGEWLYIEHGLTVADIQRQGSTARNRQ